MYLSQLQNIFVSIVASRSDPCLQALGSHLGCQRSPLLLNLSSRFPAPGTFGLPPYTKMTITSMQPVRWETGWEAQGVGWCQGEVVRTPQLSFPTLLQIRENVNLILPNLVDLLVPFFKRSTICCAHKKSTALNKIQSCGERKIAQPWLMPLSNTYFESVLLRTRFKGTSFPNALPKK